MHWALRASVCLFMLSGTTVLVAQDDVDDAEVVEDDDETEVEVVEENGSICPECGEWCDNDDFHEVYESVAYDYDDDDEVIDYNLGTERYVCADCRDNQYHFEDACGEYIRD